MKKPTSKSKKKIKLPPKMDDFPDIDLDKAHDAVVVKFNNTEAVFCFVEKTERQSLPKVIRLYYPSTFSHGPIIGKGGRLLGFGMKVFPWIPGLKSQWVDVPMDRIMTILDMDDGTIQEFAKIIDAFCESKNEESDKGDQTKEAAQYEEPHAILPAQMINSFNQVLEELNLEVKNIKEENTEEKPAPKKKKTPPASPSKETPPEPQTDEG